MSRALDLLRGRRVLVTGATGFLGTHQVDALRGIAELHAAARRPLRPLTGVTTHVADLADRNATLSLVRRIRPECVIHLAGFAEGKQAIENLYPSVTGDLLTTVNILEACHAAGCARLVVTGSLEEAAGDAVAASPYAVSKLAGAQYAELCHRLYGLPVVTARLFMTYGPGQAAHKFLPQLIAALSDGTSFEVRSSSREVDWIYVDDATEALLLAAALPGLEGRTLDVGTGALTSVGDLARKVARILGREELLRIAPPDRRDERVRSADVDQTERALAWRPRVALEKGLRRTVEAYIGQEVRP